MFSRSLRLFAAVLFLGSAVSACTNTPPPHRLPELNFRNQPPILVNVASIEVVSDRQNAPVSDLEASLPVTPENAVRTWARDRLVKIGHAGILRVVIHNASASETYLKVDSGVSGAFKKQQASRIDMAVDVSVQMLDDRHFVAAEASANEAVSRTTPEDQSLNDREQQLFDMVDGMMRNFDGKIDPAIHNTFGPWLGAR